MIRTLTQTKQNQNQDLESQITLERFPYGNKDFLFQEVPTLQVNKDFFSDPFKMIDDLYRKGFEKFGIVKLMLPQETLVQEKKFFSMLDEKLNGKRLQTRVQTLNEERNGKIFGSNSKGYTLQEYIKLANDFITSHKQQGLRSQSNDLRQNEIEFWSIVDHPDQYDDVVVEYAADLLATKYATGFEDTQLGNLCGINKNRNCIFQVLTQKTEMSGISVPWLYLGMKYANFCWHKEDLNLNSLNYMHAGAPKTWYAIPPSHSEKFLQYFNNTYAEQRKRNPRLLYDIVCQISPVELAKQQIQVLRTDQHPGELIITLGATYHAGFSHGLNCSEAVNVAPTQWLQEVDKATKEYRMDGNLKKVSFPLEWLLTKVVSMADQVKFTSNAWKNIFEKFKQLVDQELEQRNAIMILYENFKVVEFANQTEKYDRCVCKICSNYMFFSYMYCSKCLKKGCTSHQSVCACPQPKISLYIRFSEEELITMVTILESKVKTTGQ